MKTNFLQAYRQAPWRLQLQWVGIFLLVLVGFSTVAGIYLSISGRAASAGRQIQSLEGEISALRLEINDLNTQLAEISSEKSLSARLESSKMIEMDPLQALYVEVPGLPAEQSVVLAPPPSADEVSTPTILPEFTASLWDWLRSKVWELPAISMQSTEVVP